MKVLGAKRQRCYLCHDAQVWAGMRETFNDFLGKIASMLVAVWRGSSSRHFPNGNPSARQFQCPTRAHPLLFLSRLALGLGYVAPCRLPRSLVLLPGVENKPAGGSAVLEWKSGPTKR